MSLIDPITGPGCGCDAADVPNGLLSVDDAFDALAHLARPVAGTECLPLAAASGRILAEPLVARAPTPPFDNSAMDGYAIDTADLSGCGPWTLPVVDRILAGDNRDRSLPPKAAMQVLTGAAMPARANAVVMQEAVRRDHKSITLHRRPEPGAHIRRAGEDMRRGDVILHGGQCLGTRDIAAAAAAGATRLRVNRAVNVALLVTGDEVRKSGSGLAHGQIWDVNSPMLSAALDKPFVRIEAVETGQDTQNALADQLGRLAGIADLIVTTGGISVGAADFVKPALVGTGGRIAFSGVAIKPGKPVSAGRLGQAVWLGLPGNPLAAFTIWEIFGKPLLALLAGARRASFRRRHVVSASALAHRPGRCEARLATHVGFDSMGREVVTAPAETHSGRVGGLPDADGLVLLPAEAELLPGGSLLEFLPFQTD
ncbi:MAG: gephyrin-like molybdotransferase Glp [Paracoccaceae bacterium]